MRLSQLQPGGQGVVLRIEQGDPMRLRLLELGFTPGCTVMLERCGRGGDPMLLRLRAEQNLPDGVFYHYDTPLTVAHETEVLREAGFSNVHLLGEWAATRVLRAEK